MKTLDMRFIRYLNLFEKISNVRTKDCFFYNNVVVFAVPYHLVSKAIGEEGKNVRALSNIIGKKVKVVSAPAGLEKAEKFISDIVSPVRFKGIEINSSEIIINAGRQSKAALIGRNKTRLEEMQHIVKEYFDRNVRIV